MDKIKGDLKVSREINSLRSNEALVKPVALIANLSLDVFQSAWSVIDGGVTNRVIELPDATLLAKGWKAVVHNVSAAGIALNVQSFDGTFTGALLKTIRSPEAQNDTVAYQFVLIDNTVPAGVWYVIELGDSQTLLAARYVVNFLVADWPAAVAGRHTLTSTQKAGLAAATHGRGITPMPLIQEKIGTDFFRVSLDSEKVDASGNLTLVVTNNEQFDGRVVLV